MKVALLALAAVASVAIAVPEPRPTPFLARRDDKTPEEKASDEARASSIQDKFSKGADAIVTGAEKALNATKDGLENAGDKVQDGLKDVGDAIKGAVNGVTGGNAASPRAVISAGLLGSAAVAVGIAALA